MSMAKSSAAPAHCNEVNHKFLSCSNNFCHNCGKPLSDTAISAHQALYEALSAAYAGVNDIQRSAATDRRRNHDGVVAVAMFQSVIEKMAAALALADAAQGEK